MTTTAERIAAIRERLDALPDFHAEVIDNGFLIPKDYLLVDDEGYRVVESHSPEAHEYVAHAYGDLTWLLRRYEDAYKRLERIGNMPDISDMGDSGLAAARRIAREHLEAE